MGIWWLIINCLVVWNMNGLWLSIYWECHHPDFHIFQRGRYTTNQIIHYFCGFVHSMVKLPGVKQCHKPSPSHNHKLIGGINLPFPVLGGKNGIVLPTYPWFCYWDTRINRINPLKHVGYNWSTDSNRGSMGLFESTLFSDISILRDK